MLRVWLHALLLPKRRRERLSVASFDEFGSGAAPSSKPLNTMGPRPGIRAMNRCEAMTAVDLRVEPEEWLGFAKKKAAFGVFHHPAWSRVIAECYGYRAFVAGVRGAHGELVAGVPLMAVGGAVRGRRWVALPFTDHLRPLANDVDSMARLHRGLAAVMIGQRIATIELRSWPLPAPAGSLQAAHVLHMTELPSDFGELAATFRKGHVGAARKAAQMGVTTRLAWDMAAMRTYYDLHVETRRRQGVPVQPIRFFDLIWRHIVNAGMGFIMLAHVEATPVAGAVFLNCANVLTYKFSASDPRYRSYSPNNLLLSAAIQWACDNGFRAVDWGRTDTANEGLRRFKSGWGAVESPLQYGYIGREPKHPEPGRLQGVVGKTIQSSPKFVCRLIGELAYGHAG